mmetsp:Transcript_5734/g.21742  ORF Transcript_5734/g.21742 Transcript_5734/m.21742 type:complete len:161 (+) Transcript_5734:3859-4341(+)
MCALESIGVCRLGSSIVDGSSSSSLLQIPTEQERDLWAMNQLLHAKESDAQNVSTLQRFHESEQCFLHLLGGCIALLHNNDFCRLRRRQLIDAHVILLIQFAECCALDPISSTPFCSGQRDPSHPLQSLDPAKFSKIKWKFGKNMHFVTPLSKNPAIFTR